VRYFFYPVPEWIVSLQSVGTYAGYVLPLSLIYILTVKLGIEKKTYFSSYNFFLLLLLLFVCVTGIVMKNFIIADLVDIKYFMLTAIIFKPAPAPDSILFVFHFALTFVFLIFLPTHVFAAPYTMLEARKREDGLKKIIHES
jgi:cytochrome b561